jgi:hypothetical protein
MNDGMSEKELIAVTINEYCDLLRIKKYQTSENPELNFQIKQKEIKLASFGVNIKELKFE